MVEQSRVSPVEIASDKRVILWLSISTLFGSWSHYYFTNVGGIGMAIGGRSKLGSSFKRVEKLNRLESIKAAGDAAMQGDGR